MKKMSCLIILFTLMCGCTTQNSSLKNDEKIERSNESQTESYYDEQNSDDYYEEKLIHIDGFDEPMTEDEFNDIVDETEEQIDELPEETQIFIDSLISGEVYELYDIDKTFTDEEIEKMIFLALNGDDVEFILGEYE